MEKNIKHIIELVKEERKNINGDIYEKITSDIYSTAGNIARKVTVNGKKPLLWQDNLDKILTSRLFGFPIMFLILTLVFWITIVGAQVPSGLLFSLLVEKFHPILSEFAINIHLSWWAKGILIDGVYLATAWVVSVMLPPMAIFFPLFTLLEDLGYLPRVAFNLDHLFQKAGAHGKQSLTMAMGFGCNAAAIVSTRIIESPRERLIAIITNNFSLCNGRWPLQILLATVFIGAMTPAVYAGLISATSIVLVTVLGIILAFFSSWLLSKTLLKGESSFFILELPPYRKPQIIKTLYKSFVDRTLIVLSRAVVFAIPAGALIWIFANIKVNDTALAFYITDFFEPFAYFVGLNGIILLAYIIAIPANEIVIPTIIMLTMMQLGIGGSDTGILTEPDNYNAYIDIFNNAGWTLLTAINLMLFSLIHNPCSTTLYSIWKETKSFKWTFISAVYPIILGFLICALVAFVWRIF